MDNCLETLLTGDTVLIKKKKKKKPPLIIGQSARFSYFNPFRDRGERGIEKRRRERESRASWMKKGQGRTTYFKTRPDSPETSKFRGEKRKEETG